MQASLLKLCTMVLTIPYHWTLPTKDWPQVINATRNVKRGEAIQATNNKT